MTDQQFNYVNVKMWGVPVGVAYWHSAAQYASFEYEPEFLSYGLDISPVYMSIEDASSENLFEFPHLDKTTFHGLPGLLANSLPDNFGNSIINSWLRKQGRSPDTLNPIERLAYIGSRGMGALEFEPCPAGKHLTVSTNVEIDRLQELIQNALSSRDQIDVEINGTEKEVTEAMYDILRVGTSAGGAVPKAIVAINNDGHVRSGQVDAPEGYTHYILKFDGMGDYVGEVQSALSAATRVEYGYYLMAKAAGITMMHSSLLEAEGKAHFLTKRYDRIENEKIHTLNLAGLAHLGWNPVSSVDYDDIFKVMRTINLTYAEKEEQYRRMIFNVVTKNVDDHVKNFSFNMYKDGIWRLAPAYDLTFSYDPEGLLESMHKITVDGKQEGISRQNLLNVGKRAEIKKPELIIDEVIDVVKDWSNYAKQAGLDKQLIDYLGQHQIYLAK